MPAVCRICEEPGVRDSVDRALESGRSIRDIATSVNRSKSSVDRHKRHAAIGRAQKSGETRSRSKVGGTSQAGRTAGQPKPILTIDDVVERVEGHRDRFVAISADAEEKRDNRLALLARKEAKECDVTVGRIRGLVQPENATTINIDRRQIVIEAADWYPEPMLLEMEAGRLSREMIQAIVTAGWNAFVNATDNQGLSALPPAKELGTAVPILAETIEAEIVAEAVS